MEKKEQNKNSKAVNEICEERLNSLKGNYQKPFISNFKHANPDDVNCSDMASEPAVLVCGVVIEDVVSECVTLL